MNEGFRPTEKKKFDTRGNGVAALEILMKDLKVFAAYNGDLFKEIALLLTLENFSVGALRECLG
ncbi:LIS1 homology motif protein [Artemisia annua]|uniref:LIS1 homology motif protein n=1 Tax=Artemisia annua TaxID=35608 RepID=A0A2U1L7X6_ARTAN|nr:LIS1 homology motif protein [Artemisia annua]